MILSCLLKVSTWVGYTAMFSPTLFSQLYVTYKQESTLSWSAGLKPSC